MLAIPVEYDHINEANSRVNPSTMHASDTGLARFFRRYLMQKAVSVISFENLPKSWDETYLRYGLYFFGKVAVIDTDAYGPIPQWCTLYGYNMYYQPTRAIIASPAFPRSYDLAIGKETELIRLCPDYGGIYDLISYYADLLASTAETMGVNILNSKLSYVFIAGDKASAESQKKLFDKVASGQPAAVVDKKLFNEDGEPSWLYFAQRLKENFIAPDLLQTLRQIEAEFDTVIGIPNANTDKRERLITDEVNANNTETKSRVGLWLEMINEGLQRVNTMFGLNISAKLTYNEEREVKEDDQIDSVNSGDV